MYTVILGSRASRKGELHGYVGMGRGWAGSGFYSGAEGYGGELTWVLIYPVNYHLVLLPTIRRIAARPFYFQVSATRIKWSSQCHVEFCRFCAKNGLLLRSSQDLLFFYQLRTYGQEIILG